MTTSKYKVLRNGEWFSPEQDVKVFRSGSWNDVKAVKQFDETSGIWKQVYPYILPTNIGYIRDRLSSVPNSNWEEVDVGDGILHDAGTSPGFTTSGSFPTAHPAGGYTGTGYTGYNSGAIRANTSADSARNAGTTNAFGVGTGTITHRHSVGHTGTHTFNVNTLYNTRGQGYKVMKPKIGTLIEEFPSDFDYTFYSQNYELLTITESTWLKGTFVNSPNFNKNYNNNNSDLSRYVMPLIGGKGLSTSNSIVSTSVTITNNALYYGSVTQSGTHSENISYRRHYHSSTPHTHTGYFGEASRTYYIARLAQALKFVPLGTIGFLTSGTAPEGWSNFTQASARAIKPQDITNVCRESDNYASISTNSSTIIGLGKDTTSYVYGASPYNDHYPIAIDYHTHTQSHSHVAPSSNFSKKITQCQMVRFDGF